MGYGTWSRWGRGSCEGYGLDIGNALRGGVSRGADRKYGASINATDLGRYATREEAKRIVEITIEREMRKILDDWGTYQSWAEQRARQRQDTDDGADDRVSRM